MSNLFLEKWRNNEFNYYESLYNMICMQKTTISYEITCPELGVKANLTCPDSSSLNECLAYFRAYRIGCMLSLLFPMPVHTASYLWFAGFAYVIHSVAFNGFIKVAKAKRLLEFSCRGGTQ